MATTANGDRECAALVGVECLDSLRHIFRRLGLQDARRLDVLDVLCIVRQDSALILAVSGEAQHVSQTGLDKSITLIDTKDILLGPLIK